ncbi:MAG: hypothetical protein JNL92_05910 [Opitutaceae bacterium]|nr:hypothetical protein [Opitutaceae bacterium]
MNPRIPSTSFLRGRNPELALSAVALLLPKCPVCYVAFCGAASLVGLADFTWYHWTLWALLLPLLGFFVYKAWRALSQRVFAPAVLAVGGTVALVAGKLSPQTSQGLAYAGLGLLLLSSCWTMRAKTSGRS